MSAQRRPIGGPELEILILQSTRRPHRLTLRLAGGDFKRSGEVMEALEPTGFLEGDRVTLELLEAPTPRKGHTLGLDLVVIRSTVDPSRLTLRCVDDLADGGEVMERLYPNGFRPGDRARLRLLWRAER